MNRIQFSDYADGSSPYTVKLNPSELDLVQSENYEMFDTLDGASVKQSAYFDSRPYVLGWVSIPASVNNFTAMIGTLKSYIGDVKYVNFKDADYAIPTLGWKKVRVSDVDISVNRGGQILYNMKVTLSPEQ